jgi:hypothetical protein
MQIDTRLGTFEDLIVAAPDHAATLRAARALVQKLHPDAFEVASQKELSAWWGWGEGKMKHGYAYVMPHKAHVNLGFFQGVSLPDPGQLLEGTGKNLRHVKLKNQEAVALPAIRALLEAARDERKAALEL